MDNKTYLEESARTSATVDINLSVFQTHAKVLHQAMDVCQAGTSADAIKRSLFYKDADIGTRMLKATQTYRAMFELLEAREVTLTEKEINILHSILGIASEAGELMEELIQAKLENRSVDELNMVEEAGDISWYISLLLRTVGSNFETIFSKNIAKLKARYPEKFTTDNAVNRNINAEKDALSS